MIEDQQPAELRGVEKVHGADLKSGEAVTLRGDFRHARRGASRRDVARVLNTAYADGLLAA